jgi:hypothetical protein
MSTGNIQITTTTTTIIIIIIKQKYARADGLSLEKWYNSSPFMGQIHYVLVISVQHIQFLVHFPEAVFLSFQTKSLNMTFYGHSRIQLLC